MSFNKVNQTTGELTRIAGNGDIPIDSTPTQGSTNAVQSGGTFSAIKAVSDGVDEVSSQMQTFTNQVDDMVNVLGSKNLLYNPPTSFTDNGLTFTTNDDGEVSIVGTHTRSSGNTNLNIFGNQLEVGTYKFSIEGNILGTCLILCTDSAVGVGTYKRLAGLSPARSEVEFTYTQADKIQYPYIWVQLSVSYTNVDVNTVYKPMIRLASIEDDTYVPYAKTNRELSSQMQTLETDIDAKADKSNLASISITGNTNNTGSMITKGTYFYKAGVLVKAILDIANGATLTQNTNYEIVTAGGLNDSKIRIGEGTLPNVTDTWGVIFTLPPGYTKTNTYLVSCNVFWTGIEMWYVRSDIYLRINASNQVEASTTNPNSANALCRIGFVHVV